MIGPLSLDPLIRDVWGSYNPLVLAQLGQLAYEDCYRPRFYRVPDPQNEVIPVRGYVEFGLEVTPGSLLFGTLVASNPVTGVPFSFTFNLEDLSTGWSLADEPIPSVFLANYHPTVLDAFSLRMASFWNLWDSPYPVVGMGKFRAKIQNTDTAARRIEVVIGAFEVDQCR